MRVLALAAGVFLALAGCSRQADVSVGSKAFTESVILGEIATHLAEDAGYSVEHINFPGTRLAWNALIAGDIDVYPDYTGTIIQETLFSENLKTDAEVNAALAAHGIRMSRPLGFENAYAIGMREKLAEQLGIRTISDLKRHPGLRLGFSSAFMERDDGWKPLRERYALPHQDVTGLEHALAYQALDSDSIQVTDLYLTDAERMLYDLRVLEDDLRYFPNYDAVWLYREDLETRAPEFVAALKSLEGKISESEMIAMNARTQIDKVAETKVAADFLAEELRVESEVIEETLAQRVWRYTLDHVFLVGWSLLAAILVSLPLGVLAARSSSAGQVILGIAGVIQTIPAIALLVVLISPLNELGFRGIGTPPALVALFLYSLLPIVRNTHAGLKDVSPQLVESASALGLSPWARLRLVELPIAARTILAGIKTAAVINVGFATLGGFIGAGGYGEPIFAGIRRADYSLILEGAIPAAALAILVQLTFELVERSVVPKGLRLKAEG
ncbi:MAG: ABC transporter permease subunit [Armatimonadetes bacterium]|nr:ABC transporter permease subunit [Armatimonadota bacterium]